MSDWEEEEELEDQLDDLSLHDDAAAEEDFPALTSSAPAPSATPPVQPTVAASPWNKLFKPTSPSLSAPPVQPVRLPVVKRLETHSNPASPSLPATVQADEAKASTAGSNSIAASTASSASFSPLPSSAYFPTPVTHLILDSGAFISGQSLTTYGPHCTYITLPAVKTELRDTASQHRFNTFPFPLTLRTPPPEAIAAVTAFAAQTGDRRSLSAVDVSVLAMAWQVEREVNGGRWLKEKVEGRNEQAIEAILASKGQTTTIAADGQHTQVHNTEQLDDDEDEAEEDADSEHVEGEWEQPSSIATAETKDDSSEWREQKEDTADNDGEGKWITPDNLHQQADYSAHQQPATDHPSSVATITTDYAMQNVMLQMGLRLISVSGLSITSTRQFLLKCHACFHLTRDMQRQFCPACGLHTLIRATLVLSTDPLTHTTTARLYHGTRHLNKRGTRFSIPRARGGRGGGGLKLAEDVMAGFGRKAREGGKGGGGVEGLYDAGVEFGVGQSGRHVSGDMVGWGRRNPNEVRRRTGNKKKRV